MEAEKNIFGQYKPYKPITLTDDQKIIVSTILDQIGDEIQGQLSDDEFIKETSNLQATVQFLVGVVNDNLPDDIKVDGYAITPLVKELIKERVTEIRNNQIVNEDVPIEV